MLSSYILRMAEAGSRTAFIEEGAYRVRVYSYAQVLERALAFAHWLRKQDSSEGAAGNGAGAARVVLWAPPSARWAMAFYGCLLAGHVVVPVDAGFSFEFVERVAGETQASSLLLETQVAPPSSGSEDKKLARRPYQAFLLHDLDHLPAGREPRGFPYPTSRESLAEIIYTSGTTAEPRGVMITHGNLLANLEPVEREIRRFRWLAAPFFPLRFLHLIPLSHLFGQIMGLFIPQFFQGVVIFPESQAPAELARIIRKRRASVMVSVPQQLEALGRWAEGENQKSGTRKKEEEVGSQKSERLSIPARWWKFRRLHRALGWKMWAFVVGGAALPPRVEALWNGFGYAVIQGYGLTETAPAIAITHPFKIRHGSVGRLLPGAEIRLAPDGEILVRGPNVSPGYYRNEAATRESFADGWLRTGDLGRLDAEGNLILQGRKKDVIVTAEGLNVYPEDVELVLAAEPGVKEAAVVGRETSTEDAPRTVVHAVLVPAAGTGRAELEAAVARANESLEPHQRVRSYSVWPQPALPHTVSTQKVQRAVVAAWANRSYNALSGASYPGEPGQAAPAISSAGESRSDWRDFLSQLGVARDRIKPEARLGEDLGLSSLDRVELLTWLETHGTFVDGERFTHARTVAELEAAVGGRESGVGSGESGAALCGSRVPSPESRPPREPRWPRSWPARAFRFAIERLLVFPLLRTYVRTEVEGAEKLSKLSGPVLWISNHESLLDVPVILRALPARWRRRVAPAMGSGAVWIGPVAPTAISEEWLHLSRRKKAAGAAEQEISKTLMFLARLFFNAYLLPEDASGVQSALRHAGLLADKGYSTLIFPEGLRTPDGRLGRFRAGVGLMAERLQLPVVPLRLEGLYEIWPATARGPRRGRARVMIGDLVSIKPGESAAQFTARLQEIYRAWE
jgi:long-chain acyl-CoA synthetase